MVQKHRNTAKKPSHTSSVQLLEIIKCGKHVDPIFKCICMLNKRLRHGTSEVYHTDRGDPSLSLARLNHV